MNNIKKLLNDIQTLRNKLYKITAEKDNLTDPEVVRASQELDESHVRYENMVRGKDHM